MNLKPANLSYFVSSCLSDPEDMWQDMLTSELLPQGKRFDMEQKAKSLKKPVWSGQPLKGDEYEASIVATSEDMPFAEKLAEVLTKRGFKVTSDVDKAHDARIFLLIFSESTSRDENVVRHLTRAAERFNMNETVIVPVVKPGCTARFLDRIPDNIAYSLSNTSFINLSSFGDPLPKALCAAVNELADLIRRYTRGENDWCVSGTWCCQAIVKDQRSGQSKVKDFILLLHQDGTKITGRCAAEWDVSGDISGDVVHLKFKYRGEWTQNNEGNWHENDYMMVGEIAAVVVNQGYRLEGDYVDRTDAGKSDVPGRGAQESKSVGLFNATLERVGLSGVYRVSYTDSDVVHYIGMVHRGGNTVILENSWACGVRQIAFYDDISRQITITSNHQYYSWTIFGKASDDEVKGTMIEGLFVFVDTTGVTEQNMHAKLERDQLQQDYINSAKSHGDESELMALYNLKADRQLPIPFKPHVYVPLESDEYGALICCTKHEKGKAEKLMRNLDEMGIKSVTMDISKADKARTIIVLLSARTQERPDLIDVISKAAEQEKPIFNIGLDSWFAIFGEAGWKDQNLRIKLMNALARLNQTPDTTLERHHSNFHGLVRGIKKYTEPPIYYLTGLWELEYIGEGESNKTKFTDIYNYEPGKADDGGEAYDGDYSEGEIENISGHDLMANRPAMIFIYFNQATNEVIMANDFANIGLKGKMDTQTYQLKLWSASARFTFHVNDTNDVMFGTYINKVTRRKYKLIATYSNEGISGIYQFANSIIGISQSGGAVATVISGDGVVPAVISNGRLVYHPGLAKETKQFCTIAARINRHEDGVRLLGFLYVSKGLSPRKKVEATQYATSLNRTIKKSNQQLTAPPEAVKMVQAYYEVLEKKDYDGVLKLLTPTAQGNYPKTVFLTEAADHARNEGKYIKNSAKLVGKRAMSTGGRKIGQTRFEFDLDFERRKEWRVMFLLNDMSGLIDGLESLEEEARSQHLSEYDVMISYRSWDARWVDLLQEYLEKHHIVVWRDRRMEVGVNWSEDITRAVRKSGCVVSAISENYLASSLCTKKSGWRVILAARSFRSSCPKHMTHPIRAKSWCQATTRAVSYPTQWPESCRMCPGWTLGIAPT
ncbi:uncharacterized protein [Ptychodera flava]|uniref:uncharacterized protein n=1 Tax=Ptychodera flava TaxID=63121 RepID=UPI00396AAC37